MSTVIQNGCFSSPAKWALQDAYKKIRCSDARLFTTQFNHRRRYTKQCNSGTGISVLVVGGGIGGLMTALECWRIGCSVRVLERTRQNVTTGDSFSIGPSAINAFRNWPLLEARNSKIAYDPLVSFHHINGEKFAGPKDFSKMLYHADTDKIFRHSRPKFHSMLLDQLRNIGIEVEYGCEVHEYFEEAEHSRAGVALRDGSQVLGDLVVAADGIRSRSWPLVAGKEVPARSSGDAVFRVAYPVEQALADPEVAERFQLAEDGRSIIELWRGAGIQAAFWRNQDEMSWSLSHPDDGEAQESWSVQVTPSDVMRYTSTIPGWPKIADRVIQTTPPGAIVDWRLMWRDPQPKWTSPAGRVVQLGDAAHAFLPNSGNGGTQAMEDATSLATCIAIAGNSQAIPSATRVHNLLRFERVSCLQAFGVVNRQKAQGKPLDGQGETRDTGSNNKHAQAGRWILHHDPAQYAADNYHKALAHLEFGTAFKNTNVPPGMVYVPWTIDDLLKARAEGKPTVLDGDWQ